jgi:hypothetical protein
MIPEVRNALNVLKPSQRNRAAAEKDIQSIHFMLQMIDLSDSDESTKKKHRVAVRRLIDALLKVRSAVETAAKLDAFYSVFDVDSLDAEIARCEERLAQPKQPKQRQADNQKAAVKAAYLLISKYGDPKQLRLTRGNIWYQLAAIIYGNPKIDLFNHMRTYLSESDSVSA